MTVSTGRTSESMSPAVRNYVLTYIAIIITVNSIIWNPLSVTVLDFG